MGKLIWLGICVFSSLVVVNAFAEKVKIDSVLDTNCFRVKDGRFIALESIKTISIYTENEQDARFARDIFGEIEKEMLNKFFEFTASKYNVNTDIYYGQLYIEYPFPKVSVNQKFLQKGYGEFVESDDLTQNAELQKAARMAEKKQIGIMNPERGKVKKPDERDIRVRMFPFGMSEKFEASGNDLSQMPFINVNLRRSNVKMKPVRPFQANFAYEVGLFLCFLPYIMTGPEIRLFNYFLLEVNVGTLVILPCYAGSAGIIIPFSRRIRFEALYSNFGIYSDSKFWNARYFLFGVGLRR